MILGKTITNDKFVLAEVGKVYIFANKPEDLKEGSKHTPHILSSVDPSFSLYPFATEYGDFYNCIREVKDCSIPQLALEMSPRHALWILNNYEKKPEKVSKEDYKKALKRAKQALVADLPQLPKRTIFKKISCPFCGARLDDRDPYCRECGRPQDWRSFNH